VEGKTQSIDAVLERATLGSYRWMIYSICAALLALEGYDGYLVSNLAPVIARGLSVPIPAMGAVFSAQAIGFAVAYYTIPLLADYIGRRMIIILCALCFALLTYATTLVDTFSSFVMIRALAFVALGGALPNVVALAAEYLPKSRHGSLITWLFVGHGLGAAAAGWLGSFLIAYYSWHVPFWIGSAVLLAAIPFLWVYLPESCRYLAVKNGQDPRIGQILHKIDSTVLVSDTVVYVSAEGKAKGVPLAGLFRDGRLTLTLLLWVANAATFYTAATFTAWLPSFLSVLGHLDFKLAVRMASLSAFGSMLGPLLLDLIARRGGRFRAVLAAVIAGGIVMCLTGSVSDMPPLGWVFGFLFGMLVIGGQAGLNSLNASCYPTAMRSTGIGWAAGAGRVASVFGPGIAGGMLAAHMSPNVIYIATAAPLFIAGIALAILAGLRTGNADVPDQLPQGAVAETD
jgi:MFS transporter, AAHS family, 4-hydroxybenzoate transporter